MRKLKHDKLYGCLFIDIVTADIPEAQIFSVLDAKSGFMQIELDDESSLLTTFNTPIGRYKWLKLPFGIKCAPEIFQRIMDNMLEGIQGAVAIMDDILVAGKNMKDHDVTLRKVIEKATEYNLKLNMDKCSIRQTSVTYVSQPKWPRRRDPSRKPPHSIHI